MPRKGGNRRTGKEVPEPVLVRRAHKELFVKPLEESLNEQLDLLHAAVKRIEFKKSVTEQEERLLEEIRGIQERMKSVAESSFTEAEKHDMMVSLVSELRKKIGHLEVEIEKSEKGKRR